MQLVITVPDSHPPSYPTSHPHPPPPVVSHIVLISSAVGSLMIVAVIMIFCMCRKHKDKGTVDAHTAYTSVNNNVEQQY